MKETHDFLVPDYYPHFSCKMGACRNACCRGWPITISLQNHFTLLGCSCSKELRQKIDCSMFLLDRPTADEYAQFKPKWDGNCYLRMEDGRCSVHAELGEDVLPDVCRLYPRGLRKEEDYEGSCANSCEAVLELLLAHPEPLTFSKREMTVTMPKTGRSMRFETLGRETEIRMGFIRVIQDRTRTLPERILRLYDVLTEMNDALHAKDAAAVERILAETEKSASKAKPDSLCSSDPDRDHLAFGLDAAERMLDYIDKRSDSVREDGEEALRWFRTGDGLEQYRLAKEYFESLLPEWEIFFEQMLVNHMFFTCFPFQDRPETFLDEFTALGGIYALLRFLALGCMATRAADVRACHRADRVETDAMIDGFADAFRLIDHTDFDRYAASLLKRLSCDTPEKLRDLIRL